MSKKKRGSKKSKPKKAASREVDIAEAGEMLAKQRIAATPGFSDLADFYVMVYTNEELDDLDVPKNERNWVGQYSRGSIDGPRGAVVLVNVDAHMTQNEIDSPIEALAGTLCHEMGHALWELVDDESKAAWNESQADHRWGPEEAFADDFMFLVSGRREDMNNEALFMDIASPEETAKNPDERLRDLERAFAASGAAEDEARYMTELARVGRVRPDHLELLAQFGDRAAGIATGVAPTTVDDRLDYQQILTTREAGRWISKGDFGTTFIGLLVFAALEAIREDERPDVSPSNWRLAQLREILEWVSDGLARDGLGVDAANRLVRRLNQAPVGGAMRWAATPAGIGIAVFVEQPREQAAMAARLLERLHFTPSLAANLLRRLKPYVLAGSPARWNTEWDWDLPGGLT